MCVAKHEIIMLYIIVGVVYTEWHNNHPRVVSVSAYIIINYYINFNNYNTNQPSEQIR